MVFLNPTILLGLFAAAIPIIIHIINFRKLKKIEFSSIAFLKELQKSKIKKVKLKQWLLLLLRTLIIIFLILAFARPTLESLNMMGAASTAKTSVFFVIDNSFSMEYVGVNGSNFNRSRKLAKDILEEMEDGDEFNFLVTTDSVLTTTNKKNALKIIDQLATSLITKPIEEKIKKAITTLEKSNNINREIFLFSDFQNSTFFSANFNDSLNNIINNGEIKLFAFNMSLENTSNYSVTNLKLDNSIVELNKPITFSADINNNSKTSITNIISSLYINDKRVAQKRVNLGENESIELKYETTLNSKGLIEARVELEEDNIIHDNISFLSFIVPENINILLLYENELDISYVESAIKSSTTTGQILLDKQKINRSLNIDLTEFNSVFLIGTQNLESLNLRNYLTSGGKLFFMPPNNIKLSDVQYLVNEIGFTQIEKIVSSSISQDNYAEFREINFAHPLFTDLFTDKNKREIDSPFFYKYLKFKNSPNIRSIIKLIDESIFLGEYKFGSGIVMFLNSSPNLQWSNLSVKGIFAPLISRSIYYLSSMTDQANTITAGESIFINVDDITFPIIDINLPVGTEKTTINGTGFSNLKYDNTEQLGHYSFLNNDKLISFTSVNFDQKESNLETVDEEILINYYNNLFGDNYIIFTPEVNYFEQIKQARFGTELWKYFLVFALVLALFEMYIARSSKKDLVTIKENRF